MKPCSDWAVAQFDTRLAKAAEDLPPMEVTDDNIEMVANLVKKVIVESMRDGLIHYCPAWRLNIRKDDGAPNIQFDWNVVLTADWKDIDLPTLH